MIFIENNVEVIKKKKAKPNPQQRRKLREAAARLAKEQQVNLLQDKNISFSPELELKTAGSILPSSTQDVLVKIEPASPIIPVSPTISSDTISRKTAVLDASSPVLTGNLVSNHVNVNQVTVTKNVLAGLPKLGNDLFNTSVTSPLRCMPLLNSDPKIEVYAKFVNFVALQQEHDKNLILNVDLFSAFWKELYYPSARSLTNTNQSILSEIKVNLVFLNTLINQLDQIFLDLGKSSEFAKRQSDKPLFTKISHEHSPFPYKNFLLFYQLAFLENLLPRSDTQENFLAVSSDSRIKFLESQRQKIYKCLSHQNIKPYLLQKIFNSVRDVWGNFDCANPEFMFPEAPRKEVQASQPLLYPRFDRYLETYSIFWCRGLFQNANKLDKKQINSSENLSVPETQDSKKSHSRIYELLANDITNKESPVFPKIFYNSTYYKEHLKAHVEKFIRLQPVPKIAKKDALSVNDLASKPE